MTGNRVTQLLHIGIDGATVDATTRALLEDTRPAGVILFQRNVQNLSQLAQLTHDLRQIDRDLIISIDQEGGPVDRLRPFVPSMPSGMALGAANDRDLTRQAGQLTGQILALLGIDWDLAPVCDQAITGDDNAIGVRSYGFDPERIVTHAKAFIEGLETGGTMTCIKHFPGLGAATADSHRTLPVVATDKTDLLAGELGVFERLIPYASSVLVSHAYYPHLTRRGAYPATLSDEVMTQLLRHTHGFTGLTVTDDMVMGALATEEIGRAACRSVAAGADALLVCEGAERILRVATALVEAERTGVLAPPRIEQALLRVEAFRARLRVLPRPSPLHPDDVDTALVDVLEQMSRVSRSVAMRSVTATRRCGANPPRGPVVVLRPRVKWLSDECARPAGSPILHALAEARIEATEIPYDSEDGDAVAAMLAEQMAPHTWLLATSDGQRKPAVARLAQRLSERASVLHLALAWPLDLEGTDVRGAVASYGCGWDAVHTATRVLIGQLKASGELPVNRP